MVDLAGIFSKAAQYFWKDLLYSLVGMMLMGTTGVLAQDTGGGGAQDVPDARQVDPFAGVWHITQLMDGAEVSQSIVAYYPEFEQICVSQENGGCLFQIRWRLAPERVDRHRDERGSIVDRINFDNLIVGRGDAPVFEITRGLFSDVTASIVRESPDLMRGNWQFGARSGTSIWQRIEPRITEIASTNFSLREPSIQPATENFGSDEYIWLDFEGRYDDFWFGPQNDMRGNRPGFMLYVYGESLFNPIDVRVFDAPGIEPGYQSIIYRAGPDGRNGIAGRTIMFRTWPNFRPGQFRMTLDGAEYVLDLRVPGFPCDRSGAISIETESGSGSLLPFERPYRLVAEFNEHPHCTEFPVNLAAPDVGEMIGSVTLRATTTNPLHFVGPWQIAYDPERYLEAADADTAVSPELEQHYAERYAGIWSVSTSEPSDWPGGILDLGRDLSATLYSHNRPLASSWGRAMLDDENAGLTDILRVTLGADPSNYRGYAAEPVRIPDVPHIQAAGGGMEAVFDLVSRVGTPAHLDILMNDDAVDGPPQRSNARLHLASGEVIHLDLRRDAAYLAAHVLDHQTLSSDLSRREVMEHGFSPRGADGRILDVIRDIAIIGRNLPPQINVVFPDGEAEVLGYFRITDEERVTAAEAAGIQPQGLDGWRVSVRVAQGTRPGPKRLLANGTPMRWLLDYPDAFATLEVLRPLADDGAVENFDRLSERVFTGDRIVLGLMPLAGVDAPQAAINAEVLALRRMPQGFEVPLWVREVALLPRVVNGQRLLMSEPLQVAEDTSGSGALGPLLQGTDRLTINLPPIDLRVPNLPVSVRVDGPPLNIWDQMLNRARQCSDESRTLSRRVWLNPFFGDATSESLTLSLEDHAAALLLRMTTVLEMQELGARLSRIDLEGAQILRQRIVDRGPAPWMRARADVEGWGPVALADLGQPNEELRRRWSGRILGLTQAEAGRRADVAMRDGVNGLIEALPRLAQELNAKDNCDLGGILDQVAVRTSDAIPRALTLLVEVRNGQVEPLYSARSHVTSLMTARLRLRSINELSDADTAVVQSVASIALVAGGGLALEFANAGAAWLATGLAGADLALGIAGTGSSVITTLDRWDALDHAANSSAVLGEEAYLEALASQPDIGSTLFGVLMTGVSGWSLAGSARSISLARGRALAAEVEDLSELTLSRLTVRQRSDLAAYVDWASRNLHSSRAVGWGYGDDVPAFRDFVRNNPDAERLTRAARSRVAEVAATRSARREGELAAALEQEPTFAERLDDAVVRSNADTSSAGDLVDTGDTPLFLPGRSTPEGAHTVDPEALADPVPVAPDGEVPIIVASDAQAESLLEALPEAIDPEDFPIVILDEAEAARLDASIRGQNPTGVDAFDRLLWIEGQRHGLLPRLTDDVPPRPLIAPLGADQVRLIAPSGQGGPATTFRLIGDEALPLDPLIAGQAGNRLELVGNAPAFGHRMLGVDIQRDFAVNPRVRIAGDDGRLAPANASVFRPWEEIAGMDAVDALQRRSQYARISLAERQAQDAAMRAALNEAAAVGNPWARRLIEDIGRGRFDYRMDAGMPDDYAGLAVRADVPSGRSSLGLVNPITSNGNGQLVLRTPEEMATGLIHEFAHGWRGRQPWHDALADNPRNLVRGEYNETRAFIAEGRFLNDLARARALNGRTLQVPDFVPVFDTAASLPPLSPRGLVTGTRLRTAIANELSLSQEYADVYQDTISRMVALSPNAGGSTAALQARLERIDAFFQSPELAQFSQTQRAIMHATAIEEALGGFMRP